MTEKTESKELAVNFLQNLFRIYFRIYFRICLSKHKYNYLFISISVGYSLKLYDMLSIVFSAK